MATQTARGGTPSGDSQGNKRRGFHLWRPQSDDLALMILWGLAVAGLVALAALTFPSLFDWALPNLGIAQLL